MKLLRDHEDAEIRLTEERLAHVLSHPEMASLEEGIAETLAHPERIVQSRSDEEARLYYRFYPETSVGGTFLCVVVKFREDDAYILTAYLTDKIKKGEILWNATS